MHRFLVVLVLLAPASPAIAKSPRTCKSLRGTVVARNSHVKLVKQRMKWSSDGMTYRGYRYISCALPNGRVRSLRGYGTQKNADGTGATDKVHWNGLAGRFIFEQDTYAESDSPGKTDTGGSVFNLATGESYEVYAAAGIGTIVADPDWEYYAATVPAAWKLSGKGVWAGIFDKTNKDDGSVTRTVVGYRRNGHQKELATGTTDDIPVESLRIVGSVVSWTNGGTAQQANLG